MNRIIRLSDLTYSNVAIQHGIHNKPNIIQEENLLYFIDQLLDPICRLCIYAVKVKLGFVSKELNKVFKFPKWNPHLYGFAADLYTSDKNKIKFFRTVYNWIMDNDIPFHEFRIVNNKFDWHLHLSIQDNYSNQKRFVEMIQDNKYQNFNLDNLHD